MIQAWHFNVENNNAIANTRIMGVVIGGLIGGAFVGLGVNLIAGLHRIILGGFTAFACAISTIVAGVASGYLGRIYRIQNFKSIWPLVVIGIFMEFIQTGIILLFAKHLKPLYIWSR